MCISSLPNATHGGRGVLRLGDKTTPCKQCGKAGVIIARLPAMKWNGIPTVLDGALIRCDCPPGSNRLIAPIERSRAPGAAARSAVQPDGSPMTRAQPANSKLAEKTAAPFANSGAATSPADCNHPDQMEELAVHVFVDVHREQACSCSGVCAGSDSALIRGSAKLYQTGISQRQKR
ncbi:PAAR domain-containing protein [Pseudomonas fluorescens]|uniref:PAAR domain-containing protein n=1 Tax=Pseudomonas fluorescens TaxID=294 RepID=UPI0039901859